MKILTILQSVIVYRTLNQTTTRVVHTVVYKKKAKSHTKFFLNETLREKQAILLTPFTRGRCKYFTVSYLKHYVVIFEQLTMENIIDLSIVTVKNTQVQQTRMQKS